MIKSIKKFFSYIIDSTLNGFYCICMILAKGFFFYFYLLFLLIGKILPFKFINNGRNYFKNKQNEPVAFLAIVFVVFLGIFLYSYLYVDKTEVKYVDASILEQDKKPSKKKEKTIASDKDTYNDNEVNLFRKFGKMNINDVDIGQLKQEYPDVVAWLMVDGTNVNYPIVQTTDNEFYLNHDITKNLKGSGWTFMDYRNDIDLSDSNTIFYGHNLLNKTAFGSLSNVFTDSWFKKSNHYIVVKTESGQYVYEVFSCYYIEPEVYYLQNNFNRDSDYQEFLNTITGRSNYKFGLEVGTQDKIITLSTCTDDNKGRKVIHAKKIS